ncbi:MAG: hypothetical protein HY321_03275 [Armatimonadetes bacterium]|nr:hypothetical protein [Armatimonadota bacterium]
MGLTLILDVPEETYQVLKNRSRESGRTPVEIARDLLTRSASAGEEDALLQLAGAFEAEATDVSDRHDAYTGGRGIMAGRGAIP